MSIVNILTIMTHGGDTVLLSANATQSITPISEYKVIRNINDKPINKLTPTLLKCVIKTSDNPNIDLLRLGEKYKIVSISECTSTKKPDFEYTQLKENNIGFVYRPIFEMVLIDFESLSNNGLNQQWIMQFIQ